MITVERIKSRWKVTIDGGLYYMNRFGVVWQEEPIDWMPGWVDMQFVPREIVNAVQKAVTDAGYPCHWNRGEPVWQAKQIVSV